METKLGEKYKDKISGFTGIATAKIEYLQGGKQTMLTSPVKADGEFVNPTWIDDDRLTTVNE